MHQTKGVGQLLIAWPQVLKQSLLILRQATFSLSNFLPMSFLFQLSCFSLLCHVHALNWIATSALNIDAEHGPHPDETPDRFSINHPRGIRPILMVEGENHTDPLVPEEPIKHVSNLGSLFLTLLLSFLVFLRWCAPFLISFYLTQIFGQVTVVRIGSVDFLSYAREHECFYFPFFL